MKDILGINYYFSPADGHDAVFQNEQNAGGSNAFAQAFRRWIEARYDVEVHTWDAVDPHDPRVKAVLYFDDSWRYALQDPILKTIPYEKRALMMIEPSNVNPSLYFVPFLRNRFKTVFTWDEKLLRRNPSYQPINVPVGAEPAAYRDDRFADIPFADKKFLIAVSRNRWSYMPHATYRKRVAAYQYFTRTHPAQFDLFGQGWTTTDFPAYRGEIAGCWDEKVAVMAHYKFAICFENNVSEPGYISEKILDCFCARCVPIYYGSKGVEKRIPKECFIDFRDFRNFAELERFLVDLTPERHAAYIDAINRFMRSDALAFFSTEHYFRTLADGLGFRPI